ncbi:MAG: PD40 domain-containing protein [Ignavibacteria bacterium]|nr:PD40 domain-containing protein [Ignavibacteria bacterium]
MIIRTLALVLCTTAVVTAQPTERHLTNIRQLTFGGDNAEAYWSPDGTKLAFQSNYKKWGHSCDQIHMMETAKAAGDSTYLAPLISTGKGRTTCSYFMPNSSDILYASTHEAGDACPPEPAPRADRKYLWQVLPSYEIYVANSNGKVITKLTDRTGYDAEATVSPKGDKIVFTSDRSGDLELYTMDIDGSNVRQITNELGYDGGAFFSPDGKQLVYRASRPTTEEDQREYKELLAQGLVAPTNMEIFVCNVDGSNVRQITKLGKANWAPYFHPSQKKILFSSNHASQRGYDFQLYMINLDGTGLEQLTTESIFNAFPMFSPDGKHLVWSSNRNNNGTRDTNVFMADWVD